nr:5'/3'-nucleotidase SurE [Corallococcus exiguus]
MLCNDDGYQAEGIRTLASQLAAGGHVVTVVAPHTERSGQSHAMSFFQPLLVHRVERHLYAVHGTPADCVFLGLRALLAEEQPELVIVGINHGLNVGIDVNYSGTIGAATEASLLGFQSMAISMDVEPFRGKPDALSSAFQRTARLTVDLINRLHLLHWPSQELLSLNHPGIEPKGLIATHCRSCSIYIPHFERLVPQSSARDDLHVYIIGGSERISQQAGEQDVAAIQDGYATLSFLRAHQGSTANTSRIQAVLDSLLNPDATTE